MIHICDPSYKHEIVTLCYQLIDVLCTIYYIYLFHTQSAHIDKSYINSNTIIHRINYKYIIRPGHFTVNTI